MSQALWVDLLWLVAGACVIMAIYPYVIYPLILRLLPPKPWAVTVSLRTDGREFALLFCAFNEVISMPAKIENLKALVSKYPALEVLVYDDGSFDGTWEILSEAGLGQLKLVRGKGRSGKAHGMKVLASNTDREFLVFTDANVKVGLETFDELYRAYSDPSVGGICGALEYLDAEGTPAAKAGGLYWRLEEKIKSLEARSGSVMGADGSIFSIRRFLYPSYPDTVLDDMTVSMEVLFQGFRLIKVEEAKAFEHLVTSAKDDYRRRLRIATRVFHTHLVAIRPKLISLSIAERWRWWSHRYLKWHGAFALAVGYACAMAALWLTVGWHVVFSISVAIVILVVGAIYFPLGPLSAVAHILLSIFLSGVGVIRARLGRTVTVWKPPTTR